MVGKVFVEYSIKYLPGKGSRLRIDPCAWEHKIRIVKNAREHKNYTYHDKNTFWYNKSIGAHDLYTYIAFLIKLEEIQELEYLLGFWDRYIGFFRAFRAYRSHFKKLKALCNMITSKYRKSQALHFIRFRIKEEDNRDFVYLEDGVREKLRKTDRFNDMNNLEGIIREANITLNYYAEIGQLRI